MKVVDASLAIKWLVNEEDSDKALALSIGWGEMGVQIEAPHLMLAEVANALHRKVVDGQLSLHAAMLSLENLRALGIKFHDPENIHAGAVRLAGQLGQGAVYDSVYLALAERLDCELWTADRRFYRAAGSAFPDRIRWLSEFDETPP